MKNFLLNILAVFCSMLIGNAVMAQAPVITYGGGTNTVTFVDGTGNSFSPNNTGGAVPATTYGVVSTPYGSTTGATSGSTNGTGNAALFKTPYSIVGDGAGNLYVADNANNLIRKIVVSTGAVTTFVSGLNGPTGICIDPSATNLYISEYGPGDIRKIVIATGVISTVMTNASYGPRGLTTDGTNIYFADQPRDVICKVAANSNNVGTATTYAGKVNTPTYTNSTVLTTARFNGPTDVALDASGNLYVADFGNNEIREINASGVTSFAGSATGASGITNATGTTARFNGPFGINFDVAGNMYVADQGNYLIRKVTSAAIVTTLAGTTGTEGETNGSTFTNSTFGVLGHMYVDASGNLYAPDQFYNNIRQLTLCGYTETGALPAALSFASPFGNIYGTASVTGTFPIVVTAYNLYGSVTDNVSIVCNPAAPSLSYAGTPYTFTAQVTNTTAAITNTGGTVAGAYTFTITSGALPAGITFSTANGTFTCIPTAAGTVTGNVTAANAGGTGSAPITITVNNPPAPALSYAGTPYNFTMNLTNTTVTISSTGGPVIGNYTFTVTSGALPAGITFDPTSGTFTCVPTAAGAVTGNVTGTNAGGTGTAPISITVAGEPAPTISYSPSSYTFTNGLVIASITPTVTNAPTSYALTGTLPTGLSFSTANGQITGTPTADLPATPYTVTATNAGGSTTSAPFTITVVDPPVFSYAAQIYTVGTAISPLSPTITSDGPLSSATISPALPTGLSMDASGNITGTPGVASTATTYTITATGADGGIGTGTISITVYPVSPTIAYTGSPYYYTVGTAISTLIPAVTGTPTSYSISPALPAGLSFSTTTGQISGNPTAASTVNTYTISAYNANPVPGTTSINITVYPKSPTVAYTGSPYTYYTSAAITTLMPTTTNSPTSYSISPNLTTNTGLSFSTTTGQISGTPTTVSGAVTYTITATNANPTSGTTTISITVLGPPTITYTGSPYTYTVGTTITSLTPAVTNNPTSYSISPSIAANTGLAFSTTTGVISGMPTTASTPVTYTITATNPAGPGMTTISVQVYPKAPTVAYTGSPYTYYTSAAITTLMPTTTNSPTSYSISPNLTTNTGLSFSTTTGQISGTPTTVSGAVTYTITATNANPTSGTTTISITVLGPPTISYTGSPYSYTVGTTITSLTPAVTNNPTSYSISPSIAANTGLAFSTTTGVISGMPTTASTPVTYTITATNPAGSGTTTISVQVYPKAPTVAYTGSPYTYYTSAAITTLMPTTTNSPTSYSISPNLTTNTGLSFSTTTGQISGTPTTVSGAVTYTITATNANPTSGTTTISITVLGPPTIAYTGSPYTYTVGTGITTLTPAVTNNPASYSISPSITTNTGLAFSTTTGKISGTPTTASTPVTYTITATNPAGSGTTTISVQVYPKPPTIAYTGSPYTYYSGGAITTLIPTTTNSPTSFSISPDITANIGLSFSTTTGQISGTPTTVSGAVTYTITATNANPTSGTTTISITVLGPPTISYTPSSYVDTVGYATTPVTPMVTNAPTSYSISPDVNANTGLTFNTSTGVISGTPTTLSAAVTYTVTATNASGSATATITFSCVNPPPPILAYTPNYYSLGLNATVSFTINSTGGTVVGNYTISPATLPAGLTFNATTGTISGTTTTTASAVTYTVTGTNGGGTATATITIGVSTQAIAFDYNPNSYTLNVGAPLPTNIFPEVSGGAPTSGYSYSAATIILTNASAPAPVSSPLGMATDASGNLYVVNNTATGTVTEYSTTGTVSVFGTGVTYSSAPIGIVFDSSGNAYVLTKNNIYVFNSSGVYQPATTFTGITNAVGIAIDKTNNIYVATTNNNVVKFPNTGGAASVLFAAYGGYSMSGGIAVDGFGLVYIVDNAKKAIDIYNPFQVNGPPPTEVNIGVNTVYGVSLDGAGNIFVSYTGNVKIFSQSSGTPSLSLTLTGFTSPRGTVTDYQGTLYVSDYTANTVKKYTQASGYYLTSTLAGGLTFDNTSGQFSGTPTANFTATYTVYGFNSSGSGSTTISFNCNTAGPAIHYSPNTYVFAQNVATPTITPLSTGSYIPSNAEYYEKTPVFTTSTTPAASGPEGMAYDPNGNVYVVNNTSKNVMEYNPSTNALSTFITTAAYTANVAAAPIGIAFDSSGNAYILTATGVYKFNSSGTYQSQIITGFTGGTGIAIDLNNNIYVANSATDVVAEYAITGGTGTTVASGNAITGGLAVDGLGDIYVGNGNFLDEYNAGSRIARTNFGIPVNSVSIDGSNDIFVGTSTTDFVQSSTFNGYEYLDNSFSNIKGILADKYGNLFEADYGANTVYIDKPYNGYYLSGGPLPPGLNFDNTTGQFTGTPTTLFNSITFTVTAWNTIGSSSTPITFTCLQPLNWVGTTSNDWNTGSNWVGGNVPNSTQTAYIGATAGAAYSFPVIPTISAAENISVGSIIMGTQNTNAVGAGIIINGTLATPTITYQGDARSASNPYTVMLTGTGTVTTGNITVNANYSTGNAYNEVIQSSVSNMTINNSITLTATNNGTKYYNPAYNITGGIVTLNGIVTTNNGNAGNTSTLTVNNATLNISHPIVLSGLSSTGVNVVTFNGTNTLINYSGTGAPQTYYTATGLNTTTGGVTYTNIQFSGTGIKNPSTINSALSISGNFTNTLTNDANGSLTLTNTPVLFTGTTETLIGGPGSTAAVPANPGNGTIFSNVTFSGAGTKTISTGVFHVANTGLLTMSGTSPSTILNIAAAGNLTLNSNLYGSATVTAISGVPGTSGPSITGIVDAQRYISGGSSGYRGYRMLSSQVNANSPFVNINYLIKSCYMTGTTSTAGGFDGGPNPTLYFFRENLVPSNATFISGNFRGVNNITSPPAYGMDIDSPPNYHLPVANGYLFFFRGDRAVNTYANETLTTYVPTATTLTATGNLNQGSITFNNWYTGSGMLYSTISGTTTVEGYNLVGNPYASSIDWDKSTSNGGTGITTSNVKPFIYVIDPVSKNYNVYKAGNSGVGNIATANSNILSSGQGFFVVASSASATITFNESGKSNTQVASGNRNLFMGVPPVATAIPTIHLVLLSDSVIMDGTVINFDNNAKTQYSDVDAPHKVGFGTATLASRSTDSIALAYYTLPYPKGSQTIPLNVYAAVNGTYQLYMRSLQNIPSIYEVWLKDAYAKDSLDIKHNPTYSFTVNNSDTTTFGKNRFSLVIRQDPALMVHLLSFTATKITGGDQVVWTTENEQNYTNFVVQRSTDGGKTFNLLEGIVSSAQGTYSYLDKNPVQGANSYRLQLTDLNGTITYSNIVTIMYANTGNQIAINGMLLYPNPTSGTVNLAIDQSTTTQATASSAAITYNIQIINNLGSIIKTAISSSPNWQTDVSTLIPGTYFIRVTNASTNSVVGKSAFVKL